MGADLIAPVLPEGLPSEWVQPHNVYCPSCRYNLRMLRQPRCPECGLVFRWQTVLFVHCPRCNASLETTDGDTCPRCRLDLNWERLLDAAGERDQRLYEYARHPVRAALGNWVAALRPLRFWGRVTLEDPPVPQRLAWFRRTAFGVGLLGLILITWLNWAPLNVRVRPLGGQSRTFDFVILWALTLCLPLITAVTLPRFTPTLTRFRIRQDQLNRCFAYGTAGVFWIGVLLLLASVFQFTVSAVRGAPVPRRAIGPVGTALWLSPACWCTSIREGPLRIPGGEAPLLHWFDTAVLFAILCFALAWWWTFLFAALRRYLRLDWRNVLALFASTQAIGVMVLILLLENSYMFLNLTADFLRWMLGPP